MNKEKVNGGIKDGGKVTKGHAIWPLVVRVPAAATSRVSQERGGELIKADIVWPEPHVSPLDISSGETLLNEFAESGAPSHLMADYVRRFAAFVDERRPTRLLSDAPLLEFSDPKTRVDDFILHHGLFRHDSIVATSGSHHHIWHCEITKAQFEADRLEFRRLLDLWRAVKEGRLQDAKRLAAEARLDFADDPGHALSFEIGQRLSGLTLELPAGERQPRFAGPLAKLSLEPGPPPQAVIKCEDVLTGIYAHLFTGVVFRKPWMQCRCGQLFQVTGKKKFHSAACQKSAKAQRWRRKQVGKQLLTEQKKKSKHQQKGSAARRKAGK